MLARAYSGMDCVTVKINFMKSQTISVKPAPAIPVVHYLLRLGVVSKSDSE